MKPETIAIVKATVPVIQEMGTQITQRMYEIALEARPDLPLHDYLDAER